MIDDAQSLLEEVNQQFQELESDSDVSDESSDEVPELMSTSTSSESYYSDSGNSEVMWGGFSRGRGGREGIMVSADGEIVPVSIGNSSLSDSDMEVQRLLNLMRRAELNESCGSDADSHQGI